MGRRKIGLEQASAWVFNRMADVYDARPPYPAPLVDAIAGCVAGANRSVADVGAGVGHLTLPLAARGLSVTAVEPARAMLDRLGEEAARRALPVCALHGMAEALPIADQSIELVVIADALHFLDAELSAHELRRVLVPGGALALVTCAFADTPFMRAIATLMAEAAPRRPRAIEGQIRQLSRVAAIPLGTARSFSDETPVEPERLERILRSISYIGPAMNRERFASFRARVYALPMAPVWARTFTLYTGRRAG